MSFWSGCLKDAHWGQIDAVAVVDVVVDVAVVDVAADWAALEDRIWSLEPPFSDLLRLHCRTSFSLVHERIALEEISLF